MKIPCLSVLQPLADDIINGLKVVENRGWTWLKDRDWATSNLEMDELERLRFADACWKIEEYHRG
jgi:hypothetical protein